MWLVIKSRGGGSPLSKIAKPQRRADAGSLLTRFYSSVLRSARLVKGHTVVVILPVCSNECLKFVIAERMRLIAIAAILALFKNVVIAKSLLCTKQAPCVWRMFESSRGCCGCHALPKTEPSGLHISESVRWLLGTRGNTSCSQGSAVLLEHTTWDGKNNALCFVQCIHLGASGEQEIICHDVNVFPLAR